MCSCDCTGLCPRCRAIDERDWDILHEWSPKELEEWRANEDRGKRPEDVSERV